MCGFAGFWQAGGIRRDDGVAAVQRMSDTIVHRGPDDAGSFVDGEAGVALGFRRLAILDLTPLGHQPMESPAGRFTVVFNGEIYNHRVLRAALEDEGVVFRGRSDTEALCAGFERWGVRETLQRAAGMFAIAAWDRDRRTLTLARDRIGIKPLYLYAEPGFVSFGSELKALAAGPRFGRVVDEQALGDFLAMLYVPGPATILRRVTKLEPGALLEIRDPGAPVPTAQRFWSVRDVAQAGRLVGHVLRDEEAPAAIEAVLTEAVASHLESDVPLGAFLSGGIDSTTVVALMQRASSRPVRTFTVRFDDPVHDEAAHAEAVAAHLGTDHTTIPVSGDDALALVPRLAEIYDEPFADASQLPSLLVSAAARRHVTVVLTGDGGDELFAGYNRYLTGQRALPRIAAIPGPLRRAAGRLIAAAPPGAIDRFAAGPGRRLPGVRGQRLVEEKVRKLGWLLREEGVAARYRRLVSVGHLAGGGPPSPLPAAIGEAFGHTGASLLDRMLLADQLAYLPDNQMTKVDRASMAVSLEARVPLLDHRVAELAWRLPPGWLVRDGLGKWALRDVAYRHVPRALLDRPKTGFTVPLAGWLRGPLRPWAEPLLAPSSVRHGPLDAAEVSGVWRRLCAGFDDAAPAAWALLMFEAWRARWLA
jgi:asparagine synthase (glutamine-hydrolysing)